MAYASLHGIITAPVVPSVTGYRTRRRCPLPYSVDPTPADHREQTDSGTMAENKSLNQDRVGRPSLKRQSSTRLGKCLDINRTRKQQVYGPSQVIALRSCGQTAFSHIPVYHRLIISLWVELLILLMDPR